MLSLHELEYIEEQLLEGKTGVRISHQYLEGLKQINRFFNELIVELGSKLSIEQFNDLYRLENNFILFWTRKYQNKELIFNEGDQISVSILQERKLSNFHSIILRRFSNQEEGVKKWLCFSNGKEAKMLKLPMISKDTVQSSYV